MKISRPVVLALALAFAGALPADDAKPTFVSDPVVPSITPALRDLPDAPPDDNLYQLEGKPRDTHGKVVPEVNLPPHGNPLAELQAAAPPPSPKTQRAFETPIVNVEGMDYNIYPPDPTGDVGPSHVVQGVNASGGSMVQVFDKSGAPLTSPKLMETLATSSPCTSGYCDPIVLYDWAADRWMISEFDGTIDNLCVYISTTPDPTGTYYYYAFNPGGSNQDYPHYGIWPAADNSAYFVGANNGGYVIALERDKMLAGQPARFMDFTIPLLSGFGFQLSMPATHAGTTLPPASSGGFFLRPRDTEIHGGTCTNCDLMEIYEFKVSWGATPTGSFIQLASAQMTDWDQTVCGTTQFGCMPQLGTSKLLDPIREPVHFPLQYRNWGAYETLVASFVEDVSGTDKSAVHWFELRRTPPGAGNWLTHQEGVLANDAFHRGVSSAAMDGSGNIAVGYTRTNGASYAGSYYAGRLASDPLGTLPYYDQVIQAGAGYQSSADRWGDYAGMGVDPSDDCTFWFFGMYEESGNTNATRIASFRFDACGCEEAPAKPVATATAVQPDEIRVSWGDSALPTVTEYRVYRAETAGGPYALVATVPDTNLATYTYADTPLGAGKTYYFVVDATDGVSCTSDLSDEVSATLYGTNIVFNSRLNWTEVTGNGDGFLNQGEKWSVDVLLKNTGNIGATGVVAALEADGITACSTCSYGAIAAGGADLKTCTFTFVLDADFSTVNGCPADLAFGVVSKTCAEQTPAGLDEPGAFSATVASGGMTTANVAGTTGTIARRTTTTFATQTSPVVSSPGVLSACTVDITLSPPTAVGDTLTVRAEHDPGNDGTYEFTQNVYSGARSGWANVTGFNLSTMVNGTAVGNGGWRLVVVHSGSGTGANGTLTAWTLHLTSGSWSCTFTGAGSCGAAPTLRVPHSVTPSRLTTANQGVDGTVTWDAVHCTSTDYHILYGMGAGLGTYATAGGKCDIGTSGTYSWTAMPDTSADFMWFLIVGDDGGTTEGSWGFDSTPAERNGLSASNRCGCTAKDTSAPCTTP